MAEYKLIYLDFAALGEPIRWTLKLAGKEFEEERIPIEEFKNHKSRFPLGQVPILYENGVELTQSTPIISYLCRKFGFISQDEFINYRGAEIVEIVTDARAPFRAWMFGTDETKNAQLRQDFIDSVLPMHFRKISSLLKDTAGRNKNEGKFIGGDKITMGDLILTSYVMIFSAGLQVPAKDLLQDFENILELHNAVIATKEIADWLAVRPKTAL